MRKNELNELLETLRTGLEETRKFSEEMKYENTKFEELHLRQVSLFLSLESLLANGKN